MLLEEPSFGDAAKTVGEVVGEEDGTRVAADEIEQVLTRPTNG